MNFTSKQIENTIYTDFTHAYKPFSNFKNSGPLWDACIDYVNNSDLMNGMIFSNDILQIPPVKVFIAINKQFNNLSDYEKKALGAFWGFVFKFVFNYRNQRSVSIINNTNNIKSATYYYDDSINIKVI